jgi:hypothetical protein
MLVQVWPQQRSPGLGPQHLPPQQEAPGSLPQVWPQPPQLCGSVPVSTHMPVSTHTAAQQVIPLGQQPPLQQTVEQHVPAVQPLSLQLK